MDASRRRFLLAGAVVVAAVGLAYSNHFENALQFDDLHVIRENVFVRSLENIPRFFSDPVTHSLKPENRNWRPLVMTTLAIDYWLGGGLESTFYFHLSTFLWFAAQLLLMQMLFHAAMERARPGPRNFWIAWFAAALYGLHPAMAETVNYIVQRAEVLSTVGVVAALVVYIRFPQYRSRGYYLALFAAATLAKAPALVFPVLLGAYIFLFEETRFWAALKKSAPAFGVGLLLAWLHRAMTAETFIGTDRPAAEYLLAQPYVILRYVRSFFLPAELCADSGLGQSWHPSSLALAAGFVFLAAIVVAIFFTARRAALRPVAFGLTWFLAALAPTSLFPLAELENDHRMYFPFVGLTLAAVWAGGLLLAREPFWRKARVPVGVGLACLLLAGALGVRQRNEVWRDDETLWRDVVEKSPKNSRALAGYASALVSRQRYEAAIPYFERSIQLLPSNPFYEDGLALALAAMGRHAEAETHFRRAIAIQPNEAGVRFYYARWLHGRGRSEEAAKEALAGLQWNPTYMDIRYLLLQIYAEHGMWQELRTLAQQTLAVNPGDAMASQALQYENRVASELAAAEQEAQAAPGAASYLRLSSAYHRAGRFGEAVTAAQQALRLQPGYAEAYGNLSASFAALRQWDQAITAAREALRLKPELEYARKNLEFASAQKAAAGGK